MALRNTSPQSQASSISTLTTLCDFSCVTLVTLRTYPNQKPWITGNIRTELKARAAALKEWDTNPDAYKKSCYALRRTIKQANCQYRTKIESYYTGSTLVGCGRACKLLRTTKGNPTASCPVTRAYQMS
jgi:hypothetical protein